MNKRIIYQNDEGGVAVIIPCDNVPLALTDEELATFAEEEAALVNRADEDASGEYDVDIHGDLKRDIADFVQRRQARLSRVMTAEEIAAKDVPTGKPYKIVDVADIPTDRQWRAEWTVDVTDLTDGVGA